MKILITGSSSEIGQGIAGALLDEGHSVVAFDQTRCSIEHERLISVEGDVRQLDELIGSSVGCDAGIHLAVLAGDSEGMELLSVNVLGAYAFLMASKQAGFCSSVLVSSAPVHLEPSEFDLGLINSSRDADLYDLSKNIQEIIAQDFNLHGLPVFCLRIGHVVFGERALNLDAPIPLDQLEYCRGGWVALEDVISFCIAALSCEAESNFRTYNLVGSLSGRDRFDVATTEKHLGVNLRYDFSEYE